MTGHYKQQDLFGGEQYIPIMALAWKQPFAALMLYGKQETRQWPTKHRGRVLICSSLKPYPEWEVKAMSGKCFPSIAEVLKEESARDLFGYAIAIGVLTNCRPMMPEDEAACYVEFNPRLYVHEYADVKRIEPFRIKNGQGWRKITDQEVLSKIIYI